MPEIIRPMSRQSYLTSNKVSPIVKTKSYQLIKNKIELYLRGYERGFSILISALRGMGKTSTILHIINQHQRQESSDYNKTRPLEVELDAPAIFDAFNREVEKRATVYSSNDVSSTFELSQKDRLIFIKVFFEQVITHLYRRLSREFIFCFEEKQYEAALQLNKKKLIHAELLGKLQYALTLTANIDLYRSIWQQQGVLERGVLFNLNDKYCPPTSRQIQGDNRENISTKEENQGIKEILAISVATVSFRKIAGKFEHKSKNSFNQEQTTQRGFSAKISATDIMAFISLILSGTFLMKGSPFLGSIALGGSLAFFVFSYVTNWQQTHRTEDEATFDLNTDPDTIARDLPYLLDCIKRCGLSPIFIVDELDKLTTEQLSQFLSVMKNIKHIITEKSFFIYITSLRATELVFEQDKDVGGFSSLFKAREQLVYRSEDMLSWMLFNITNDSIKVTDITNVNSEKTIFKHVDLLIWSLSTLARTKGNMLKINQILWKDGETLEKKSKRLITDSTKYYALMQCAIDAVLNSHIEEFQDDELAEIYLKEALYYSLDIWQELSGLALKSKQCSVSDFIKGEKEQEDGSIKKELLEYLSKRFDFSNGAYRKPETWFNENKLNWLTDSIIEVFELLAQPYLLLTKKNPAYYIEDEDVDFHQQNHWLRTFFEKEGIPLTQAEAENKDFSSFKPLCRKVEYEYFVQVDQQGVYLGERNLEQTPLIEHLTALSEFITTIDNHLSDEWRI